MFIKLLRHFRKLKKEKLEESQLQVVLNYLSERPDLNVIDLGFNIGEIYRRIRQISDHSFYYGFEIQEDLVLKAKEIDDEKLVIINAAATDRDGEINFYEPKSWSKNYKGGATIMKDKNGLSEIPINVPSINFSNWLEKNSQNGEKYFIKIDIEGAEYDLLENLINSNALQYIQAAAIEWHCSKLGPQNEAKYLSRKNLIKLALWENGIDYFEWF
ncbi:MAG: hypothetical protein CBB97_06715 [Candidatus Endolissoclinum sp. TMED37]|nr:MAG: hypothetical protein CBB97_06715 [Candidatus Endolissoclinum sp. TMED37]|tara:strand:- start:1632 stop:2276 length:645 start_codon:yes stop_codon:yes gene_type:complete